MSSLKATELKVPVAPRKGIQDSLGFWIPGTEFRFLCQWDLDSGFQSWEGFRITWAVFQIPKSRIRIAQPKFLIFRIPQAKIPGFRNFLTRGDSWIPDFSIFVQWCEVQYICTYFSWQVLYFQNILATLSATGSVVQPWCTENWAKIQASR